MCRDRDHYRSISLRKFIYSKLGTLTDKVTPGVQLSRAKVVEKLINDKVSSLNANEAINEIRQQRQKI
jgi:hypothetical protein